TDSAWLAAMYGLPYAFASHFAPARLIQALEFYFSNFRPSHQLSELYAMPCINIIAAETEEEAHFLSTSLKLMFTGVVSDNRSPMPPPVENIDEVWSPQEKMIVEQMLACTFIGSTDTLKHELADFLEQTQANEIMISSNIYDHQKRLES